MNKRTNTHYPASGDATQQAAFRHMSESYLRLEGDLDRIERAASHYEVLGISRSATAEEINRGYKQTFTSIHPSYSGVDFAPSSDLQRRIKCATKMVTLAFSVLSNFGKKVEYDNSLFRRPTGPLSLSVPASPWIDQSDTAALTAASNDKQAAVTKDPKSIVPTADDTNKIIAVAAHGPLYSKAISDKEVHDRRRVERFKLSIPAHVEGYTRTGGKWREMAKVIDVSRFGVALQMRTRMLQGTVLHLTLPLPVKLRSHGYSDPSYNVYAIVRRVGLEKDGLRVVGVEYLGEKPPPGFLDEPWSIFKTGNWEGPDRRREPRQELAEVVAVTYLDESGNPIRHEVGLTENLSASGAQIYVKAAPPQFDAVRVTSWERGFESLAALCNRYVGKDGFERLCLQFLEAKWPL